MPDESDRNLEMQAPKGNTPPPYRIFISYTNDDSGVASALYEALRQPYPNGNDLRVDLMRDFQSGVRWRDQIDECLSNADLLLLVYTGNPRQGWTGYEVGFFSSDIKKVPFRFTKVRREIVPVNFLGKRDNVTDPIHGVQIEGIQFSEENITRPSIAVDQLTASSSKVSKTTLRKDPLYRLFYKIANNVEIATSRPTTDEDRQNRDEQLEVAVAALYEKLHSLLRERPFEDDGLQNKLIVSVYPGHPHAPAINTIEFQNGAEEFFQIASMLRAGSKQLAWAAFEKEVLERNRKDLAALWIANLKELIRSALSEKFVENNLLIPCPRLRKTYRAVVARIVSFYSGRKDIHIYLFELYKRDDHGDVDTSMFANAVEIGCRYRSLFLEPDSRFSPKWMGMLTEDEYQKGALQLIKEMDLIHQDSMESNLQSPQFLAKLYGTQPQGIDLDTVPDEFRTAEANLRAAAAGVFMADKQDFAARKKAFRIELLKFCLFTHELNADYVGKAMEKLDKRTKEIRTEMQAIVEGWKKQLQELAPPPGS